MVPPSEDDDDGFATNFTILIGGVFNSHRFHKRQLSEVELGVQSAKSAGCPIYALTTTQSAEELYEADRIFASYSQLYEALESEISRQIPAVSQTP